ncbi:uncharacterized protein B0H18DRAFT_932429 [Fomitopsis serialis]|uniref:uncharacterized protein n=1 Tax=Fomitopsis serialis TaxID=139415 RepID=UPI0020079ED9|nr:uncharacterized protein B0H18DRAFT_932429 [Neoantrodia serialis]KAH9927673.1 hypothetical protein B0H18DRAFT_932429 [Neoantrodia serialis]
MADVKVTAPTPVLRDSAYQGRQGPTIASNKMAMSRALGAAFLNHQVQQLEKTVSDVGPGGANWRDRRTPKHFDRQGHNDGKRPRGAPTKPAWKRDGESTEIDSDETGRQGGGKVEKDADVIVVDASVLVHAINQVKKWCREGREEIVIVPLEALNTLDLLKKGMSSLAQRARAASRILEAQVGTNPRIRVQRDDAFVLWDGVFDKQVPPTSSPEWVRRTICCARWEIDHVADEVDAFATNAGPGGNQPRVVLAVLSQAPEAQSEAVFIPGNHLSASPVPLPAPQTNRHEPRSSGALVALWAAKAGIEVLEVPPAPSGGNTTSRNTSPGGDGRRSPQATRRSNEEDRAKRGGRRNSHMRNGERGGTPVTVRPSTGTGLVERPPAVMAMMEAVAQPSRVVRVLARGEKLEPDT